jgi:hypothetical protein
VTGRSRLAAAATSKEEAVRSPGLSKYFILHRLASGNRHAQGGVLMRSGSVFFLNRYIY